jgi:hypothetical protein
MQFKVWLEAKIPFTAADVMKAAGDGDYVPMWIDFNGNVHLEFQSERSPRAEKINLRPKAKQIELRSRGFSGGHVWPRLQQLLRSLMDKGIIDATWTVNGGSIGRYVDRTFESKPEEINARTAGELAQKSSRLTPVTEDLIFYHGTSELDWESIKRVGLHPLGSKYVKGAYESRAKHELNKDLIYLASSMQGAWDYAKTRTRSMMKQEMPGKYELFKNSPECDWPMKPVVLRVKIPDIAKLRSDDDAANQIMRKWADILWNKKSKEEQARLIASMSKDRGFDVKSFPAFVWRETDAGFSEIMNRVPKRVWMKWLASIRRYQQVGYKGYILPKFLEPIPMC